MSRRLGNHRVRPALSPATRAKAQIAAIEAKLVAARRAGDAAAVERLEKDRAWAVVNSL